MHRPRVLLVHGETQFCAGAQRMLGYFLEDTTATGTEIAIARAPCEALDKLIPSGTRVFDLPENQRFSVPGCLRQVQALRRLRREFPFGILHGWTARDWELTAVASLLLGRRGMGLLHDHPRAAHISASRQRIMRLCSRWRLDPVICVSQAVADACQKAGYPPQRLKVIRNGIPLGPPPAPPLPGDVIRLGFLGVFSERKGLRTLFQLLDAFDRLAPSGWTLAMAGGAQDAASETLVDELKAAYASRPWWSRVSWIGWVPRAADFLTQIDLLIVPSSEFDPFPTVLLEAGAASRPAFAAHVGGVAEILDHGKTGWVFDPSAVTDAARQLSDVMADPARLTAAGQAAALRVRERFSVDRMAKDYGMLYSER